MSAPFRVFIGWDSREPIAYDVARHSLLKRASIPVEVTPIKVEEMRARGLYTRGKDPLASTEFTYTRFLTPALAGFSGWALFCDCDFLWLGDIAELAAYTRAPKAIYCVQHDYRPKETTKMDGAVQTVYPRKNWSSLMLFNCDHPAVRQLTPEVVNSASGAYLHRLQWVDDADIGDLPTEWNWLEGWNEKPAQGTPKVVHYTRGGPWFADWQDVDYGDLWRAERDAVLAGQETDAIVELARFQRPQLQPLRARVCVFHRHQQRDVGGDIARQPPGGGVQVALEKDIGDDRLQDDDGRDDDDQRAAEQSARQETLDGKSVTHGPPQPRSGTSI